MYLKFSSRLFFSVLLLTVSVNIQSQESINKLLDSLSTAKSDREIIDYSIKIASGLKFTDWERAEHYLSLAEEKSEKSGSTAIQAEFYKKAAHVYYDKDMFDIALNYNLKALDFYKDKFPCEQNEIENLLAVIYSRLNNKEKALYYFKRIYTFHDGENNFAAAGKILNNIGMTFLESQEPDSAIIYFNQILPLLQKIEDDNLSIRIYVGLGRANFMQNNMEKAEEYFQQALKTADILQDKEIFHYVYFAVAEFYSKTGKQNTALQYAQKAMSLNIEKYSVNNMVVLKLLYEIYDEMNNYKEASYYFREYDMVRDSLKIEEKTLNVEKQRIEYQFKAQQEIDKLNERQGQLMLVIIILALFVVLLMSGVFLIRYKNKLVKEKLKNELNVYREKELKNLIELKDKELATKTIVETKREEVYNSILKDLKLLKLKTNKGESKEILDNVVSRLENTGNKSAWEEFEMRFTKIYESFYQNLSEKHPKLSVYDKRVCALIRLNLTTKEIADLTGVTVRSVENTRTRLRKKLKLTNQKIDLVQYLSEL